MAKKLSPPEIMRNLAIGYWVSRLVYVAAKLKLADLLKGGSRTVEDLAAAADVQPAALYRLLRALASVGIFAETKGRRFKLTPLAATLKTGVPDSMHAWTVMVNEPWMWDSWNALDHGVKTGEMPFRKAHGVPFFQFLEQHPEDMKVFGESMSSLSKVENPAIAAAYTFPKNATLVDVAGGHGSLLAAILKANPRLQGVLFDQPGVIARAEKDQHVTAKGIARRCRLESGNFFEAVPTGGDAYIMKYILHDWNDEECVKILSNCRAAMNEKGKVLVVDAVVSPGNDPSWGKLLDIQMLIIGGRERTKAEFAALFAAAGLKLTRVVPTKCALSIVEGVRA
ncbi:MAG: acetylserotonin O-methyltransferase [Nitrospira sp.]|nr:acetylserotonin O-methyltransferase [Nitrospira sp.]